jgi:GNAT superfamily N-acetyltransferase
MPPVPSMPRVFQVASQAEVEAAREIIAEYGRTLGVDLAYQDFERELAKLPGDYVPPSGRLLLAEIDGQIAACVALRACAPEVGEMKRLFVRRGFRGRHLGRLMATRIIEEAKAAGYKRIQLDSLPFMHEAVRLYRSLGFEPCAPYYETPIAGTVFLERALE